MSILVKRNGNPGATNFEYLGYCETCGELFKYNFSDLSNPIGNWHENHINCPTCGRSLGFSNHKITEINVTIPANEPFICTSELLVPSGIDVYGIFYNGTLIYIKKYSYVVPAGVPMVFMTDQGSITLVDAPNLRWYPDKYIVSQLVDVNENNYGQFFTLNQNLEIVPLSDLPSTKFGIYFDNGYAVNDYGLFQVTFDLSNFDFVFNDGNYYLVKNS